MIAIDRIELLAVVCTQNTETEEVLCVTQHESVKYHLTSKWVYVEKYMWKTYIRLKREERKKEAEENRIKPTGTNRKMKRRFPPRFKPGFKFIQHKKKSVEYETEVYKGEEYYVERTESDMWPESEYEYIPVNYGKLHPDKEKRGKPYMIFGHDKEGNKILKQAIKRQLKRVYDKTMNIYKGATLIKVEKWTRVVKESKKSSQNVKSTKQMETGKYTSTRIDQRSKQENKSVEKVRGDDKRIKTPNSKH